MMPFFSTPIRSPRPGQSTTPLVGTAAMDVSNDDLERAERRRSVALRRSILNLPSASPIVNDSARLLSEEDMKTHLQICTKLHAENKINVKNAWSLKIIDVLQQMVTKNNPDILKIAGNSLEIAGKVYGLRVDDLHAEGLKLAGSLARNFNKRSREDEEAEEDIASNAPPQEKGQKKQKQKKRRPFLSGEKKHTVNPDPKSWKGPLPKLESAAFSARTDPTVSAVSNMFTNKVKMDPAGYKFMFLSKEKAWSWTPGNDPSVKEETNKKFPVKIKPVGNLKLCAAFKDFHLDEWNPNEENKELLKRDHSQRLEEVVYDDNGIPIPELDGSIHDVFQERDVDDLNNDDLPEEEVVVLREMEHITDFRPTEAGLANSLGRSEYSYNNIVSTCAGKVDQIWAGPSHWKLKFIRRTQPVYTGQDRQEQEIKKKRAPRKKNEPVLIDIANLPEPVDFSLFSKKPPKKKNTRVDPSKLSLPLMELDCAQLFENLDGLMMVPSMKPVTKHQLEVGHEIGEYRYDNPNDSGYIPQNGGDDEQGADLGDDLFDNLAGIPDSQEAGAAGPLTLVDAPQMVPQSYALHYSTKAKRMDMKKLKQAMWCALTHTVEFNPSAKVIPTTFSQMYKDLPKLIPEKMKQEISCPLAFVSLLHLCNENNLGLKQGLGSTDFRILGPDGAAVPRNSGP